MSTGAVESEIECDRRDCRSSEGGQRRLRRRKEGKEGKEGGIQMSIRARSSSPRPTDRPTERASMHNVRVPSFPLAGEAATLKLPAPSFLGVLVLLAALDPFPISDIGFLAGSALPLPILGLQAEAPPSPTLSLHITRALPCPFLKKAA